MNELDRLLKDARIAIVAKEFPTAIALCQNALRIKKTSYMALILLGAALQDRIEAKAVFLKAISIKNTSPLAYHGLAKFYEKQSDEESSRALFDTYCKILELDSDNCDTACSNVYNAALKVGECTRCVNIFYEAALIEKINTRKEILCTYLIKTLNSVTDVPWEEFLMLCKKVIDLVPQTALIEKTCHTYLECIFENKGYNVMFETGLSLLKIHNSTLLRDLICKSFCEYFILEYNLCIDVDQIEHICLNLLGAKPESINGIVTNGIVQLFRKNTLIAYNISVKAKNENKSNNLFPLFYGHCCIALGRWFEAEVAVNRLIRHSIPSYAKCAKSILIASLASQDDPNQCTKAINMSLIKDSLLNDVEHVALFHAFMKMEIYNEAENCLKKLKDVTNLVSLSATLLDKCGKTDEAFELLHPINMSNVSECIVLGNLYKDRRDYKNAIDLLIHAASLESHNFAVYFSLGECYMLSDNIIKAKKCFQKTVDLNPECSQAGKLLSNIYTKLKDWGSNYELLKMLMDSVLHLNPSPFQWVWFQLGLHYIALEQWDEAIANLRIYIRLTSSDINAWEMLAGAYFSRGSYTSALKCFNKVVDMDPERKYCYVQIGTLENMLGMLDNALDTFNKISEGGYLPALKGLAEIKLSIAQEKLSQKFYGLCRDNAQEAIDSISIAISNNANLSCLWKILYQAVTIITNLPLKYCWLYFNPEMLQGTTRKYSINDMYLLAIQCIEKAIKISNTPSSYFYHELATTYFKYYDFSKNVLYAKKAYVMTKKCIEFEMKNWQHWNLLGIICSSVEFKKYTLAQHAFIKGLDLDPCNPTIWSNLGVFYLITGNIAMANQSFMKAQESNPSFIQSWIGQALIAESVGHHDALDLFRHSSQLGFHKESSLGYAYWISSNLICANEEIVSNLMYSIEHMHAIPDSCDLVSLYNEFDGENACSWNIYGILLEKLGQFNNAIEAFIKSLKYVDADYRNIVLLNLGRLYFKVKNYPSAIDTIKSMSDLDCNSVCLLADCYLNNDQIKEAYFTYNKALEYNAINDVNKAEILIALAHIAYTCQDKENAELLIFQCIDLQSTSFTLDAITALCAMSLLFSDRALSHIALAELKRSHRHELTQFNVLLLETYMLFVFENPQASIKHLTKTIKTSPNNPHIWQLMSRISSHDVNIVNISSKKTLCFGNLIDFMPSLKLACISELLVGNYKNSKVLAQKAILNNPGNAENWSLLVKVLSHNQNTDKRDTTTINNWLKMVISRIIQNFSMETTLFNWFNTTIDNIIIN